MSLPFALPDWVPWWVPLILVVPLILYAITFLAMPFGLFGLKGRIEGIEGRLDEIQGEIRSLSLRLPEQSYSNGLDALRGPPPVVLRPGPTVRSPSGEHAQVESMAATDAGKPVPGDITKQALPRDAGGAAGPMTVPAAAPPIVPIPPASRDLTNPPRRFIRPVTRQDPGRNDSERKSAAPLRPSDVAAGVRNEPRIDWPR